MADRLLLPEVVERLVRLVHLLVVPALKSLDFVGRVAEAVGQVTPQRAVLAEMAASPAVEVAVEAEALP